MPYCPQCGTFNWDDRISCDSCGADLFEAPPPAAEPGPSPPAPSSWRRTPIGQKRSGREETGSIGGPDEPGGRSRSRIGHKRSATDQNPFGLAAAATPKYYDTEADTLGGIFSEALRLIKENPVILLPTLIPTAWSIIVPFVGIAGASALFDLSDPDNNTSVVTVAIGAILFIFISFLIFIWAHAATIRMFALSSERKGMDLFLDGWKTALERTVPLILGGLIAGILVLIGLFFCFIPGLIAFLLLFVFVQAIMIDDANAVEALGKSADVVKTNWFYAIVIFLVTLIIPIMLDLQTSVLSSLPGLAIGGTIIGAILLYGAEIYATGLATIFYMSRR